jgi:hypothetical protein
MQESPSEFISKVLEKIREEKIKNISSLPKVVSELGGDAKPGEVLSKLELAGCKINLETGELTCSPEYSNEFKEEEEEDEG